MAGIKTTGNADIDQATAEIAVALRDASLGTVHGPYPEQQFYDEAVRLRDAIMAGTRDLDADEPTPEEAEQAHDIYLWRRARGAVPRAEGTPRAGDVIREGR